MPKETFSFEQSGDTLNIIIKEEFIKTKGFNNSNYLYYHFENDEEFLEEYFLIDVYQKKAASIDLNNYDSDGIIRAHYKGFTLEFKIE